MTIYNSGDIDKAMGRYIAPRDIPQHNGADEVQAQGYRGEHDGASDLVTNHGATDLKGSAVFDHRELPSNERFGSTTVKGTQPPPPPKPAVAPPPAPVPHVVNGQQVAPHTPQAPVPPVPKGMPAGGIGRPAPGLVPSGRPPLPILRPQLPAQPPKPAAAPPPTAVQQLAAGRPMTMAQILAQRAKPAGQP